MVEEIERVCGSRTIKYSDNGNMPYTSAVIAEIQRLGNLIPLAVVHRVMSDITVQGYFLPKGILKHPKYENFK